MKALLLTFSLCCSSSLIAASLWDFSSGAEGWTSQEINFRSLGWDESVSDGFKNTDFPERVSAEGGYLGAFMFASVDAGDISQYNGGFLNITYKDTGAGDRGDGMTPIEYVFLSGQVGGQNITLGYELKFSEDWQTVSISIDKSTLQSCTIYTEEFMPGDLQMNFSWAELSDEDFDAFLSDVSIHLRSDSYMTPGGVGGETEWKPISLFDSVSLSSSPIPEPSSYALIFGGAALGWIAMRRRRK